GGGAFLPGLMRRASGRRGLRLNGGWGDPGTRSLLRRPEGGLRQAPAAAATGEREGVELPVSEQAAVTIVLAARDYPAEGDSGTAIAGVEAAEAAGALVFHAGTALQHGRLVTNGGRILDVTALGDSVADARERAYTAAAHIDFDGVRYRRDIASFARA